MDEVREPKPIKIGSLYLDPKNSRIPPEKRDSQQRQLLHALLESEDVVGLAKGIATSGLFPNERLVVMADGRRFIVLEGNRRLAAAKLLINPDLAPTELLVKRFRALSQKADTAALLRLKVVVVPNRLAAAAMIASAHIGASKRRWSSLQQARFYSEMLAEGQELSDIADECRTSLANVKSFLRMESLHRMATKLEYPSSTRAKIEDSQFNLTTLERFVASTSGRKFLGIDIDSDGEIVGKVHEERFRAALGELCSRIVTEKALTRAVNTEKEMSAYLGKIKLPKTRIRGRFKLKHLLGEAPSEGEEAAANPPSRPPRRRPSKSIIPRGFPCSSRSTKVQSLSWVAD